MEANVFEPRLKELSAMTGSNKTDSLWNATYEELLEEVKADADSARRYAHALRLRKLADCQAEFLLNEWMRLNRNEAMI